MRNKIGNFCIILGTALILGALSLFLYNRQEARAAQSASADVMPQLVDQILKAQENAPQSPTALPEVPEELLTEEDLVMPEEIINGYPYIGYLHIPTLELELPIMSDWTYEQLRISPCRYTGTVKGNDFVILAHNYVSHFGRLSELSAGDDVSFTDMDGNIWRYQVVTKDVLNPQAVEEMMAGEYDLTLFTCTPGGSHRVTIRCDKVDAN